jgi:oligopeptide transport system permease protein
MATYVIRRILAMIPALVGISLITFVLMHSTKGGPFTSEHANPALIAVLERAYGLDQPLWPTFYGAGAGAWQTLVLVVGLALLVGGILLAWLGRRRVVPDAPARATVLHPATFGRLGIILGAVLTFWWVVMLIQGPVTRLGGSGFTPGQYLRFLWNISHGDLGPSFSQLGRNVTDIILPAATNSFVLGGTAFLLLVGMAVPLGVIAALRQNTWIDYVATTFALVGYSIPNFVLGVLLILLVGLRLGWLPIAGWGDPLQLGPLAIPTLAEPYFLILPAFVLAIRPMAVLTRLTRASMLEVLTQDYIRTAWSKGLSGRVVVVRHALRNALLPIVTVMGDQLGDLVTGSLVVESLFAVPGIGQWFVVSVNQRDYGMIMGTTIFYATLVLVINLVVDLLYGVIDPRVRVGARARS